ncbi:MAG: 4Fe-4S dicluster domain-containing protein [Bacteroidales bacterium]|nr:4Fe-4S dicluster domain-containing protein [Bacteroidales bacterium]MBR5399263.1 4Fe-4S dicluster domain-containing protein [Bacteroidales bacterium]MBR6465702.1 4Fe-4S dicluster domain-containing protein [Bacteroidales bacterium]
MIDFGFGVSPSSRINLDSADKEKFNELAIAEPDVLKCMACGSCSASCTAAAFEDTSLRRAILSLQNGLGDDASKLLSHCMLCGKCTMVCPRGINTRHLILSIQKIYSL